MKKSEVIKALTIITFIYVGLQIFVVPAYLDRAERDLKLLAGQFERLLKLLSVLQLQVFVIDPELLSDTQLSWEEPSQLVSGRKSITLGHLYEIHTKNQLERNRLHYETIGYRYISTASFSPLTGISSPSHHFLCSEGLTVHVVEWFNRTTDKVWTDQVTWLYHPQPGDACHLDEKYFYHHSGLYDSFNLTKRGSFLVPSPTEKFLNEVPDSELVECNRTRARLHMDKYGQNYTEDDKVFMRKARQTVARAKKYLDELGIPFWLSSGTCLGWFRQCDIIPYSKDVDLGIFIKHFNPDLIHAFEQGGFFLKHIFGKVSDSYELSFQSGDIKLDLFFFYEDVDHIWNGGTHHADWAKIQFSLCWTIFLDLKVRVPCPSQPYIEANYGKDWLEPVHNWEWNRSPPNVRDNGVWPQEEWKEVIQVF